MNIANIAPGASAQRPQNDSGNAPGFPNDAGRQWPSIPSVLAYAAGCVFTLAASATNLRYGIARSSEPVDQLINGSVAVACSVIFALALPALAKALASRSVARTSMVAAAIMITGTFSIAGALGSAAGQRASNAAVELHMTGERARLQVGYDRSKSELAKLEGSLPSAVLAPRIDALRSTPGANGCSLINGPVSRDACAKVEGLEAEGRALDRAQWERRSKLEIEMQDAAAKLASIKPGRLANADAAALTDFATALGWPIQVETINRLLVLLQVLLLECGGGLSFCVAQALAGNSKGRVAARTERLPEPLNTLVAPATEHLNTPAQAAEPLKLRPLPATANSPARMKVLDYIRAEGGRVHASQRALAAAVGLSVGTVNGVLNALAAEGVLHMHAGTIETSLTLAR